MKTNHEAPRAEIEWVLIRSPPRQVDCPMAECEGMIQPTGCWMVCTKCGEEFLPKMKGV